MLPESNGSAPSGRLTKLGSVARRASAVAVCGMLETLRHSTVSPAAISTVPGSNVNVPVISTTAAGCACAASAASKKAGAAKQLQNLQNAAGAVIAHPP